MPVMLDLVVPGSPACPALNLFLQATLSSHASCSPLQATYLISPCRLELLRWGGRKDSRPLKKQLHILFPVYLRRCLPPMAGMLQDHLRSFQLCVSQ